MPLTGHLTYSSSSFGWNHTGFLFVIGEDDNHYAVQVDTGFLARVGLAETNVQIGGIDNATWQADVVANVDPPPASALTYKITIAAQGTPYFFVGGSLEDSGSFGYLHQTLIFIRYKIDAAGDIVYDGYARYRFDDSGGGGAGGGGDLFFFGPYVGATVANNRLWFVGNYTDNHTIGKDVYPCLTDLPLIGDEDDTDASSFAQHNTRLPFSWTYINEINSDGRNLENKAAVFSAPSITDPSRVGVVVCKDTGDFLGPALFGMTISGGSVDGTYDVKTLFGFPFDDSGDNYAGSPSGSSRDRYTISNIILNEGEGYWEWIFSRVFTDNTNYARIRQFTMNTLWADATAISTTTYQHSAEVISGTVESVQYYRESSTLLEGAIRDNTHLYFGFVNLSVPITGGNVGGSGTQLEPIGCVLSAQPYALEVRDLNSILELGPFRFVEQKDSDETSMITTLVLGLTEVDTGLLVEIDLSLVNDLSDLNQVFGDEVDLDAQVDVLGDDVEIDMGEGVGNSDDFTLELLGNDDGSTYPGPPIEFKPEVLSPIDDRGSTKQYSPTGYSFIYHRVRLKATEVDEKFAVKFVDISGQLTGRLM